MPIPEARPGLVIRYDYIWKHESRAGRDTAAKDRPACIVLTVQREAGDTRVLIVPITHALPRAGEPAVELPAKVKAHLGLDDLPSWVVLSEANIDVWPSPDMRAIPGHPGRFAYGLLPLGLLDRIRREVLEAVGARRLGTVEREG